MRRAPATTADLDRDTLAWCAAFLRGIAEDVRHHAKGELHVARRNVYIARALTLESAARRVQACESAATRRRRALRAPGTNKPAAAGEGE